MRRVLPFLKVCQLSFTNLKNNDPVRMAGATAFFAFFGLPPIIIILSQVLGTILQNRQQAVSGRLFSQLAGIFGPQSAQQLQDISQHLEPNRTEPWLTLLSIILLLLASTTLFAVVKRSLNQLWNVKLKSDRSNLYFFKDRFVSLVIILGSGVLFMTSITIHNRLDGLSLNRFTLEVAHHAISVVLLALWFAMLFKYLPDIRVPWSAIRIGALVTGVLFVVGEAVLNRLLTYSQLRSLHGTAGRITLVLLFVYYCALIFYFGASFTRQYAQWVHVEVEPNATAIGYTTVTEEDEPKPIG